MAVVIYTHCRHCGEQLVSRTTPYCPPCNLYLAYRALPILLGMLITGHIRLAPKTAGAYILSRTRQDLGDIFPCKTHLCGVSPAVTSLCECTASEC